MDLAGVKVRGQDKPGKDRGGKDSRGPSDANMWHLLKPSMVLPILDSVCWEVISGPLGPERMAPACQ